MGFTDTGRIGSYRLTGQDGPARTLPPRKAEAWQGALAAARSDNDGDKGGMALGKVSEPFDAGDLYGPSGQPRPRDIAQDNLGDCYYLATLAGLADQQPDRLRDAISYNAETGTFTVTLHREKDGFLFFGGGTEEVTIEVTQQEIRDNIRRGGGSMADDLAEDGASNRKQDAVPIWPAVMEVAMAKMMGGPFGLDAGYEQLRGGTAGQALEALTGSDGGDISRDMLLWWGDRFDPCEVVGQALADGRPVMLSTDPDEGDGLADNHVYMVERIRRTEDGQVMVQLRNPWGHNNNADGIDSESALVEVSLDQIVAGGGFDKLTIGPEPVA